MCCPYSEPITVAHSTSRVNRVPFHTDQSRLQYKNCPRSPWQHQHQQQQLYQNQRTTCPASPGDHGNTGTQRHPPGRDGRHFKGMMLCLFCQKIVFFHLLPARRWNIMSHSESCYVQTADNDGHLRDTVRPCSVGGVLLCGGFFCWGIGNRHARRMPGLLAGMDYRRRYTSTHRRI